MVSSSTFFSANEMFLEQRRCDVWIPSVSWLLTHGSPQERLGEIPPFRDVGQSSRLLFVIDD